MKAGLSTRAPSPERLLPQKPLKAWPLAISACIIHTATLFVNVSGLDFVGCLPFASARTSFTSTTSLLVN